MGSEADLTSFLAGQAARKIGFILVSAMEVDHIDVVPTMMSLGPLIHLRIAVQKSAIGGVVPSGEFVEFEGRRHEVVFINFAGDLGTAYAGVFDDLISNLARSQSSAVAGSEKAEDGQVFTTRRDWCAWSWPVQPQV